ncbi:uncharacterized protein LOC127790535 [Diospyros lotus]|uniref:uncharacterized protein LOC127790535 n=1 Tax=Diospyros lotus TaxID=55363 RepID=UPI002256A1CF|nr:uncharacterized protein LOC127790535 [Diospyros lotus]
MQFMECSLILDKMDVDGDNSGPDSKRPRVCKNEKEDKKSAEELVPDSSYVNHAEIAWHESRRVWVADQSQKSKKECQQNPTSSITEYEDLLASSKPFNHPIPLAEIVEFLVGTWHEDGLYK